MGKQELGLYYPDGSFRNREEICKQLSFPDKKQRGDVFDEATEIINRSRNLVERFEIGQKEGIWIPVVERPDLPLLIDGITDEHYGSNKANVELWKYHLDIVENTINMGLVTNGDNTDNFNAVGKWASGMFENPLPPQIQARAWTERMLRLNEKKKIGAIGFGNHNDMGEAGGQDWYDTFLGKFDCPIFTTGGKLTIKYGNQEYLWVMSHRYWGTSKLNPTNACKRFMEHEFPEADVIMLGHTHQSEGLMFERGGVDRIGFIGGTFKDRDTFAGKRGIGGRSGKPGWVVALWGDRHQMQLFKDIETARDTINAWKVYKDMGGRV